MIRTKQLFFVFSVFTALSFPLWTSTGLEAQNFDFPEIEETPNLEADFIIARMWMLLEQYDQASELMEELLDKDPNNPVFLYEMARCMEQSGDSPRALELAERAHRNDPDNPWTLQLLANIAASLDRNDLAEDSYRKLMKIHPERTNYGISRAYHLLLMDQRKAAIEVLNEIEAISGITPEVSLKKISIFQADEDWKAVADEYWSLTNAFPRNTDYKMEFASFLESRNRRGEAMDIYREVLSFDPGNSRARMRLSELETGDLAADQRLEALLPLMRDTELELDDKIQAIFPVLIELSEGFNPGLSSSLMEIAEMLTQQFPNRAEPHALAGDIAFTSYQFNTASEYYNQALKIKPGVIQVWLNQFESLLRTGNFEKLKSQIETGMDFYPNQALFHYYMARALTGLGEIENAENPLRRGSLMSRRQPELSLFFSMAEAALEVEKEEGQKALAILNEISTTFPFEPDLLLLKANILLDMENTGNELKELLDKLNQLVPFDPDYIFLMARYYHLNGNTEKTLQYFEQLNDYDISVRSDIVRWRNKIQG